MKLILVRHGETTWNAEGRIQGHLDPKLSALGIRQARLVADALAEEPVSAIYSSDLRRALRTAEVIAERHDIPIRTTPLLREANLGRWQGHTRAELEVLYPEELAAYRQNPAENRPSGAERLEDVIERARRFIADVQLDFPEGTLIVATHGGLIRGALCCVLNVGRELYRKVKLDNAGITIIGYSAGEEPHVYAINETCHLQTLDESTEAEC